MNSDQQKQLRLANRYLLLSNSSFSVLSLHWEPNDRTGFDNSCKKLKKNKYNRSKFSDQKLISLAPRHIWNWSSKFTTHSLVFLWNINVQKATVWSAIETKSGRKKTTVSQIEIQYISQELNYNIATISFMSRGLDNLQASKIFMKYIRKRLT